MEQFLNEIEDYSGDTIRMVVLESMSRVSVACLDLYFRHQRENHSTGQGAS